MPIIPTINANTPANLASDKPTGRLWARWVLCVYIPLMLALTHWPNLKPPSPDFEGFQLDKLVHFAMYVLLTFFLHHAKLAGRARQELSNLILAAGLAGVFSLADEYTQGFVPGRTASMHDAITNLAAIASFTFIQAMSLTKWKEHTALAWFSRAALCLLLPYLAVLTLGPTLRLENILLNVAPALGIRMQADKLAHLIGAAILTWLIYGAQWLGLRRHIANLLFAMVVMAIAGPALELVQWQVGRGYEVADMAAHSFGLGIGLLVILMVWLMLWIARPRQSSHTRWSDSYVDPNQPASSLPQPTSITATPDQGVTEKKATPKGSFLGAAVVVSSLTLLSRITGLIRDVYLAGALGLSGVADAFWFGFQVPNLFRRLFGEGALTAAFIPVYTQARGHDPALASRFASLCFALTLIVLGSLTLLGELLLAGLLWQPDLSGDWVLAIQLTQWMLPYMPMVCLVALCGAVLQVHGRFAPAAGMPIFLNLVMIAGTWLALRDVEPGNDPALRSVVYLIAGSVVIAGAVQLVMQLWLMLRYESLSMSFAGAGPLFTQFRNTFIPSFLALAVFQINTFMDAMLAMCLSPKPDGLSSAVDATLHKLSLMGYLVDYPIAQGGLAALNNAQRLYQFPLGVFGVAIATAIFPALAHAAAIPGINGAREFRRILQQGLRLTVFIGLPASVGLMVTSLPLARVLFERGSFTLEDSQRVMWVLLGYAPAIWAYSMSQVLTRAFYAVRDTRTPMVLSLLMVALNFVLNITLVWVLGAAGLAWATAICAGVQCILMLMLVRGCVEQPIDRSVWIGWGKTAALSLLMAVVLLPFLWVYPPATLSQSQVAVQLLVMVSLGAGIYLAGAYLLHCPEMGWLRRRRG